MPISAAHAARRARSSSICVRARRASAWRTRRSLSVILFIGLFLLAGVIAPDCFGFGQVFLDHQVGDRFGLSEHTALLVELLDQFAPVVVGGKVVRWRQVGRWRWRIV